MTTAPRDVKEAKQSVISSRPPHRGPRDVRPVAGRNHSTGDSALQRLQSGSTAHHPTRGFWRGANTLAATVGLGLPRSQYRCSTRWFVGSVRVANATGPTESAVAYSVVMWALAGALLALAALIERRPLSDRRTPARPGPARLAAVACVAVWPFVPVVSVAIDAVGVSDH